MTVEEKYRIVFNSCEIERRYRRRAKREMAKKFRLNRKKVNQIFSFRRITIKKNITFREAVKLQIAVEKTGGACEIRPMVRKPVLRQDPVEQQLPPTEPMLDRDKKVSSWYDHVTTVFIGQEVPNNIGTKGMRYRRQPIDRRMREERRLAIRMQIERRGTTERREENRVWKRGWRK